MSIKEILKKIEGVEGIEESDIEELKGLDKPKTETKDKDKVEKDLKEAKAAQARILEEKKALQAKTAELESQIEDLKSGGLSEVEKTQKELDKSKKAQEKMEAEMADLKKTSAAKERAYKIDRISSQLSFIDTVPSDMRDFAVTSAFKEVEDLDDTDAVTKILDEFKESHKGVLASNTTARGSGSTGSSKDVNVSKNTKDAEKMSDTERAKHIDSKMREANSI